jgi:hypothetical protein
MPDRCVLLRGLIRSFFPDYLRLIEQDAIQDLRLDRIRFLTSSAPSLVAQIADRHGESVTVLVRIEPAAMSAQQVGAHCGATLRSLGLSYGCPVLVSIVFLTGGRSGIRLESAPLARLRHLELARFYYTTFSLGESRAEHYLQRPEPLAWALAAGMRPAQRGPDDHRQACLDRIAGASLNRRQRAQLRRAAETFAAG